MRAIDGGGSIVATVSIADLLQRQIPRWIGQSYAVRILDEDGAILAEKAHTDPAPEVYGHVISFDPPLPGLRIAVAPLNGSNRAWDHLLPIGIVSASVLAVLSLALLHRQSAERKQAEARLAAEVAFRHSMEDSLTVGLRAKDHDGAVLYVNPAFCDLVGYAASELVGTRPPMPYWLEDLHAETLRRQALLGNDLPRPQSFETRFRRRDGRIIDVQVYEAPLIDGQGRHRGWMGSFIDISESKRASELARIQSQTLQRTGRLVTMGEMASTLAHELNQPLSAIASYATGSLNLLGREDVDPAVLRPALERLAQQADRAGQVIRRIQDFTRKRDPRFRPVALANVVSDSLAILAPDARTHGIRLLPRMAEGLTEVAADPILLEQVLINLVRNGIEAMAANPDRATSDLTVALDGTADEQVIEVIDAGGGIDPAIAERLFDPFTSTKPEGMGIGLNICRSIVELHNGRLRHRPNPAGGTIFTVVLPVRTMEEVET
jgi:two-component system sensor histidine kinase DctS